MPELNSTGTATRPWQAGDELLAVVEGGAADDSLARLSSIPASVVSGFAAAAKAAQPPGGAAGKVQASDGAGGFAGAEHVEIEGGHLRLPATLDVTSPAADGVKLFGRRLAGRILPSFIGPSGLDSTLQAGLHGNSIFSISPANNTTVNSFGGLAVLGPTISHQQTADSPLPWQATRRIRAQTSGTAGNAAGIRTNYGQWFRGSAPGRGGFWLRAQFGMNINLNGGQKFIGLTQQTGILGGDPSSMSNFIGIGYDAADPDTGNWFLMRRQGGAVAKVDLGANAARNVTDGYDLIMFCAPGGSEVLVRLVNLSTGVLVLEDAYSTDIPAAAALLAFKCDVRNGSVAAADNIELAKAYIESDY